MASRHEPDELSGVYFGPVNARKDILSGMIKSCLLMVEPIRWKICQVGVAHRFDHLLIYRITSNDESMTPNQQIVVVENKLVSITLSIPAYCMKLFNIALTRPTDECKRKMKMEEEEEKQKEKE